jgi:putative hydrolase of the HAD superfamily
LAPRWAAALKAAPLRRQSRVWLFDLDDTLHDASSASMPGLHISFGRYIEQHLRLSMDESDALRRKYWLRYGATLLGLVKHHGVDAAHFLHHTHQLPGLEDAVRGHAHDFAALRRLRGRKYVLTNAPRAYAERVLGALGIRNCFDGVLSIEDMQMFGQLRPKPDARMLRRVLARLRLRAHDCLLVEDTLQHQKAARRVGMRTVWMQRWSRAAAGANGRRWNRRPAYVDLRVRHLGRLVCRWP